MTSRRFFWPAVAAIITIVAGTAVLHYTGPPVEIKSWALPSGSDRPIRAVYFLPRDWKTRLQQKNRPAVVAIPPYSIPPEAMEIICIELARRDVACAVPDFFGDTPEESRQNMGKDSLDIMTLDVMTIIAWMRHLPFVERSKTGVCGHSVGGTVTVLAALNDPEISAAVPIGMESLFFKDRPKNLLFLSGLYDEIHSPKALLKNLAEHGVAQDPRPGRLYGSFKDGTARKVAIIPTTDHFIETFDHMLIRELLDWYAKSFDDPDIAKGPLREWSRRVAAFFFIWAAAAFYALVGSMASTAAAGKLGKEKPHWLLTRLFALPLVLFIAIVYWIGKERQDLTPLAIDLMLTLVVAQELVNHKTRAILSYGERSPFRTIRGAVLVLAALGVSTLISFGVVSAPYFIEYPEWLAWHPVFSLNMAVLFPVEVWGRVKPWFFDDMYAALDPNLLYFGLLAVVVLAPGMAMRGVDRLSVELLVTIRGRLKPSPPEWLKEAEKKEDHQNKVSGLKWGLLILLLTLLGYLGYRRVAEGMLTPETAVLAAVSILQFAVLPFVITALIVRAKWFRKISLLD